MFIFFPVAGAIAVAVVPGLAAASREEILVDDPAAAVARGVATHAGIPAGILAATRVDGPAAAAVVVVVVVVTQGPRSKRSAMPLKRT